MKLQLIQKVITIIIDDLVVIIESTLYYRPMGRMAFYHLLSALFGLQIYFHKF